MKYSFLLLLTISLGVLAAPKTPKPKVDKVSTIIKDANQAIKNRGGQPAVQARALQAAVREDVSNAKRCQLYYTAALLDESMNEAENRKAYLKQPYDTANFFNTLLNMYNHLQLCDSVDHVPSAKGIAEPRYRRKTSSLRMKYRLNILNGGKFFYTKRNYVQAYPFFDAFYKYRPDDESPDVDRVVQYAAICCYFTKNHVNTLRYVDYAANAAPEQYKPIYYEYKAETYRQMQNDSMWVKVLEAGVNEFPSYDYFFVHLVDWYYKHKMIAEGLHLCDKQIEFQPDTAMYWYAKSRFALASEDFDHCIEYADSAIIRKYSYVDAHYNKAIAYISLAIIAQETACTDIRKKEFKRDREHIRSLYRMARPSMELVRQHEPENKERWGSPLYRIYLNLNMGKEFDEIDKLLKQK